MNHYVEEARCQKCFCIPFKWNELSNEELDQLPEELCECSCHSSNLQ